MDDKGNTFAWLILLLITVVGALAYLDITMNERMALQGYQPRLIEGSNQVFWWKPVQKTIAWPPAF